MQTYDRKIDLLSYQFIVHRWRTTQGREIYSKILQALHANENINHILEPYILKHPTNFESYEFPYYPPDAVSENAFWVLAIDDLRGIHFYNEEFIDAKTLVKLNLSYSVFTNCNLSNTSFDVVDLSYATLNECDISHSIFSRSRCNNTQFKASKMNFAVFLNCSLKHIDIRSSDLRGCYFEESQMQDIKLNYLTKIDKTPNLLWHKRRLPDEQLPDIFRAFRMAYEDAKLYSQADFYFMRENVANRKYIVWKKLMTKFTPRRLYDWVLSLLWSMIAGYGSKPWRTLLTGIWISLFYTLWYYFAGVPNKQQTLNHFWSALYLSLTTYSTLGYGDVTYLHHRPFMRLVCTSEAWLGAVMIALFIVTLSRKLLRR